MSKDEHEIEPAFASPDTSPLVPILSTLVALVVAIEAQGETTPAPAIAAYRRAIRRKGEELIQVGGFETMTFALAYIRQQTSAKADDREAILNEAWDGLPGWKPWPRT